jgi:outer membrane protein
LSGPALAETLPEVLVRTYQGNPQLNAERARLRGTDEGVPQALAGYRPQIMAILSGGLQAVRVLLPDNTVQTATLRSWTIGLTVTQSEPEFGRGAAHKRDLSARDARHHEEAV